jgi:hypothetical protein
MLPPGDDRNMNPKSMVWETLGKGGAITNMYKMTISVDEDISIMPVFHLKQVGEYGVSLRVWVQKKAKYNQTSHASNKIFLSL